MAITPRRWRRRIRLISSLEASGSLIPSDLRIRFPQVERDDIVRSVELLAKEPRDRELAQHLRLRPERDGALRRRGLDAEDDHASASVAGVTGSPPSRVPARTRAAPSARPTPAPRRRRRSSAPRWPRRSGA